MAESPELLVGLTMVCNEADIIETTIRHNASLLDIQFVVSNPSIDGTNEIIDALIEEGLPVIPWSRSRNTGDPDGLLSSIYPRIQDILADPAIIIVDADELIIEDRPGALREEIRRLPEGKIGQLSRRTYLPGSGSSASAAFDFSCVNDCLVDDHYNLGKPIKPRGVDVDFRRPLAQGRHSLVTPAGSRIIPVIIRNAHIAHLPVRSSKQVVGKSLMRWTAREIAVAGELKPSESRRWKETAKLFEETETCNARSLAVQYAAIGYCESLSSSSSIETRVASLPSVESKYSGLIKERSPERSSTLELLDLLRGRPGVASTLKLDGDLSDDTTGSDEPPSAFPVAQHLDAPKCDWAPISYVCKTVAPDSAIDVGCGLALYLDLLKRDFGVSVLGIEGTEWTFSHRISEEEFIFSDLSDTDFRVEGIHDLSICLEVLEHLPEQSALNVARQICGATSKAILFSAGQPDQPGSNHINLHPAEYWVEVFRGHGWYIDEVATLGARFLSTLHWFRKNIFVFRKEPKNLLDDNSIEAHLLQISRESGRWPSHPARAIFSHPGERYSFPVSRFFDGRLSRFPSNTHTRPAPEALLKLVEESAGKVGYNQAVLSIERNLKSLKDEARSLRDERERLREQLAHARRYPWKYLRAAFQQRL